MGRADRHASRQLRSLSVKTRRWVAPAAALTVLVASCSGGSTNDDAAPTVSLAPANPTTTTADPTTTTTAPPTTTTTTPIPTDEEQIDALIERYWETVVAASDPPDPDFVGWDDVATPENAERRRARAAENIANNRGVGQAETGAPLVLATRVAFLGTDRAVVHICLRDNAFAYELDTGDITQELHVVSLKSVTVRRIDVGWRVDSSQQIQDFDPDEEEQCVATLPAA